MAESTIADGKIVTELTESLWHGQQWIEEQLVELEERTPIVTQAYHGIDVYDISNKRLGKKFEFYTPTTAPLDNYYTHVFKPLIKNSVEEVSKDTSPVLI